MSNGFLFLVRTLSPLHAGTGQAIGMVDLPIEREKHTNYPCVFATGLKGALRIFCERNGMTKEVNLYFGEEHANNGAGGAVFTDLKLLFFPVRSSHDSFKWVTSKNVLKRFERDYQIAVKPDFTLSIGTEHQPVKGEFKQDEHIVLEDFIFDIFKCKIPGTPKNFILNDIKEEDYYIIQEDYYKYLVKYSTQIIARNKLKENKISDNLWYEETLPADTILYSFITPSIANQGKLDELKKIICGKILQIGGGETVGYGICKVIEYEGRNNGN